MQHLTATPDLPLDVQSLEPPSPPGVPPPGPPPDQLPMPFDPATIWLDELDEQPIDLVVSANPSFDSFYRQARPSIARALSIAVGDSDLGVEAADEAMARAYERWNKVRCLERPEGWVYRVGLNWATSVLRRRRNHHRLFTSDTVEQPAIAHPEVHAAIAELDVAQRSVVVCRYLLGWSVAETAKALGVREGTVKSRLHRAARVLQSRLSHLAPDTTSPTRSTASNRTPRRGTPSNRENS